MATSTPRRNHAPVSKRTRVTWLEHGALAGLAIAAILLFTSLAVEHWRRIPDVWYPAQVSKQSVEQSHLQAPALELPFDTSSPMATKAIEAAGHADDLAREIAGSAQRWQLRPWMAIQFGLDVIPLGVVSTLMVMMPGPVAGRWFLLGLVTATASAVLLFLCYEELWAAMRLRMRRRLGLGL